MEGTFFSGSLCNFLSYIKNDKGIVASNWPRQISSQPSKIMMHVGFEGSGTVRINSSVCSDVTNCTGNVVDR
jgi:hypothetical protein